MLSFERNSATILVMLDMSAAFDTVDINKLLNILEFKIGLKGTVLRWFRSFLSGRHQKVLINGSFSELLVTLFGVPQGSVLGPVLFNIYIRSLPSVIHHHGFSSSLYADDSNARSTFALRFQYYHTCIAVPKLIKDIEAWMQEYFLKINSDKTEIILFCPPTEKLAPKIQGVFINDDCIRFSNTVRLLGVELDTYLSFDCHVNKVVSECHYYIKNISKIKRYLTTADALKLIHAIISSKLDYCNSLLYGVKKSTLDKLQKVQNRAARVAYGLQATMHIDIDSILADLHWLKIKERNIFKLLLLVHKFFIGIAPNYFAERLLVKDEQERLLYCQYMNTASGRRSFSYCSPRFWNKLPRETRLEDNSTTFKTSLKTILFTNENNIIDSVRLYYT